MLTTPVETEPPKGSATTWKLVEQKIATAKATLVIGPLKSL